MSTKEKVVQEGNEIAERPNQELEISQLAAAIEADGDTGFEGTSAADYAMPFLKVLDKSSPQCLEMKPEYMPAARPGMFLNTANDKLYDGKKGVQFVPVFYQREGTLWVPGKTDGSGFRGTIPGALLDDALAKCTRDAQNKDINEDGLQLVDTRKWFGLLLDEDDGEIYPVMFPLKSTQLKKSKKWLEKARAIKRGGKTVKLWSQVYRVTTVGESNEKGSYYGVNVPEHIGTVPNMNVFNVATEFRSMIMSGRVKVEEEAPDEEIPF